MLPVACLLRAVQTASVIVYVAVVMRDETKRLTGRLRGLGSLTRYTLMNERTNQWIQQLIHYRLPVPLSADAFTFTVFISFTLPKMATYCSY